MKDETKTRVLPESLSNLEKPKVKTEIIIIKETFWKSIVTDMWTFAIVVGIIGVGALLHSSAMQWAGFLMLAIACLSLSINKHKRMTIREAMELLTKIEKEQ